MSPRARARWIGAVFLSAAAGCGGDDSGGREIEQTVLGCDPAATGWTVWAPNQGIERDSVFVLRPTEDATGAVGAEILAEIPAGRSPHNIGFTPDGRRAYVANLTDPQRNGTVSVIDTRTYDLVATVEAGVMPHWAAVTPDGRFAWVANVGAREVTIVDTGTNQVVGSVETGQDPAQIEFAPDGAKAWVSNGEEGTVAVVDVAARQVVTTVRTGHGSMGLELSNDGRFLFETEPRDDRVSVIDAATDTIIDVLTFGGTLLEPHGIGVAGGEVLVTNATADSLAFVDSRTFERVASVAVPGRPQAVAVSPDCRRAYLTMQDAAAIAVVDVTERRLIGTIDMGIGNVHGIAVLPGPEAGD
ncbi:MAG: beta-propeller fold lactonase family protein [Deltaproteobacteria bacterium]|nr:beta-propeller fold lactonase family protein [Deltaproteobacteria bacterium]